MSKTEPFLLGHLGNGGNIMEFMKKVNEILYVRERADNNNLPNGEKMEKVNLYPV